MGYIVVDNLRGFAHNRPPLVVFMICLGLLAAALLTLAYYIRVSNDIPNPDASQDWNVFLEHISQLEFCITNNTEYSSPVLSNPGTTLSPKSRKFSKKGKKRVEATTSSHTEIDTMRNYSMPLLLTIMPTPNFLHLQPNITHVTGTVYGKQLGLEGDAAEEAINMTAELPYAWNNSKCEPNKCKPIEFYTCVHLTAAISVFPTGGNPDVCQSVVPETGVEYHARMVTRDHKDHPLPIYFCKSMPIVTIDYKFNPRLAVMLSLEDRSLINLHLMHTSYFLFVMVVMLFCYALFRGRPSVSKITQTDKVPLTA